MSQLVAEAIVDAGYGTAYYDEEAGDCIHECYASIVEVVLNEEYWGKFVNCLDADLNHKFELGFCFDGFRIKVFEDESYPKEEMYGY